MPLRRTPLAHEPEAVLISSRPSANKVIGGHGARRSEIKTPFCLSSVVVRESGGVKGCPGFQHAVDDGQQLV
ncbi:hypothetical protein, partial [Hydrogenophaga sp.]|uniref:hypothetical protein n=1 Tax=Hydrogenophaga sp. TaxID=1904254 RepID=UPI00272D2D28